MSGAVVWGVVGVVVALGVAVVVVLLRRAAGSGGGGGGAEGRGKEDDGEKLISLVFLLKEPREVNVDDLCVRFSKALGKPFSADPEGSKFFVVPFKPPMHAIMVAGLRLGLIHSPDPYVPDRDAESEGVGEARLYEAIKNHKAWMAIDSFDDVADASERRVVYRIIGNLMASLGGKDVLAVYAPETGHMVWYDDRVLAELSGSDPLKALEWDDPIVDIPEDDPEMLAAIAEARRTFGKFAEAFAGRTDGQVFAVKGPFGPADEPEHMWMTVTAIGDGRVHGALDSRPGRVTDLYEGAPVQLDVGAVEDWAIAAEGEMVDGGHTMDVMRRRMERPRRA
jgi:uncharacterized protein YegJ (DUF2314 family)